MCDIELLKICLILVAVITGLSWVKEHIPNVGSLLLLDQVLTIDETVGNVQVLANCLIDLSIMINKDTFL